MSLVASLLVLVGHGVTWRLHEETAHLLGRLPLLELVLLVFECFLDGLFDLRALLVALHHQLAQLDGELFDRVFQDHEFLLVVGLFISVLFHLDGELLDHDLFVVSLLLHNRQQLLHVVVLVFQGHHLGRLALQLVLDRHY